MKFFHDMWQEVTKDTRSKVGFGVVVLIMIVTVLMGAAISHEEQFQPPVDILIDENNQIIGVLFPEWDHKLPFFTDRDESWVVTIVDYNWEMIYQKVVVDQCNPTRKHPRQAFAMSLSEKRRMPWAEWVKKYGSPKA